VTGSTWDAVFSFGLFIKGQLLISIWEFGSKKQEQLKAFIWHDSPIQNQWCREAKE
jgi:hypothetical protein